jgi:radical SAM-linked protein
MQRLRVKFARGEQIRFISHLDLMRCWERAMRRAEIPLAYSEGFTPHPRIAIAAPLALGVTSEAELMDVTLDRWVSPHWFTGGVSRQLPDGISIAAVVPVALTLPSLQSAVRLAEYRVEVASSFNQMEITQAIEMLLSLAELPWQHRRDTGEHKYDLRALIDDLWVDSWAGGGGLLGMSLRCDSGGSGRPEQVTLALGVADYPKSIHRTKLVLSA